MKRCGHGEPQGGRARSVRAQLVVGSKPIQAECKNTPKLNSSLLLPPFLPSHPLLLPPPPCLIPKVPRKLAIASNTPLPQGRSAKACHCHSSTRSTPSQLAHRRTRFSGPKPCAGIRHSIFHFSAFLLTTHPASTRYHSRQG